MASSAARATRPRERPASRPRPRLVAAALMVLVAAFLPWLSTGAGNISGIRGGGLYTMYAAFLGIAGAILPWPRVAAAHAAVLAVVAVALPVWQVVRALSLVGTAGWVPGPGLVLTLGGGVLAGTAALALLRMPPRPR